VETHGPVGLEKLLRVLSSVTFKMASAALPTEKDREMFTLASKFSDKLSAFPNKDEGCCFPSDTRDFHPSA
jgi:hypothetical protein